MRNFYIKIFEYERSILKNLSKGLKNLEKTEIALIQDTLSTYIMIKVFGF
jgi:hypothetical protein